MLEDVPSCIIYGEGWEPPPHPAGHSVHAAARAPRLQGGPSLRATDVCSSIGMLEVN